MGKHMGHTLQPPTPSPRKHQMDEAAVLGIVQCGSDFVCVKCKDTGYLNDSPITWGGVDRMGILAWQLAGVPTDKIAWCDCAYALERRSNYEGKAGVARQSNLDRMFRDAGIPNRFQGLTLFTIPEQFLPGKTAAIQAADHFIKHFHSVTNTGKKRDGLVFIGPPGTGKTGILSVAFQAWVRKGKAGLWIELYHFLKDIQAEYGKEDGRAQEMLKAAMTAPLLFLDDCGDPDRKWYNKNTNEWLIKEETDDKRQLLWEVVEHRHANGLPMLVTSNLARADFEKQWGTRLAARLWEACVVVPVNGVDLREVL
jgi:DNA replication protein DnaC